MNNANNLDLLLGSKNKQATAKKIEDAIYQLWRYQKRDIDSFIYFDKVELDLLPLRRIKKSSEILKLYTKDNLSSLIYHLERQLPEPLKAIQAQRARLQEEMKELKEKKKALEEKQKEIESKEKEAQSSLKDCEQNLLALAIPDAPGAWTKFIADETPGFLKSLLLPQDEAINHARITCAKYEKATNKMTELENTCKSVKDNINQLHKQHRTSRNMIERIQPLIRQKEYEIQSHSEKIKQLNKEKIALTTCLSLLQTAYQETFDTIAAHDYSLLKTKEQEENKKDDGLIFSMEI